LKHVCMCGKDYSYKSRVVIHPEASKTGRKLTLRALTQLPQ